MELREEFVKRRDQAKSQYAIVSDSFLKMKNQAEWAKEEQDKLDKQLKAIQVEYNTWDSAIGVVDSNSSIKPKILEISKNGITTKKIKEG